MDYEKDNNTKHKEYTDLFFVDLVNKKPMAMFFLGICLFGAICKLLINNMRKD